jgi:hypothetical protein
MNYDPWIVNIIVPKEKYCGHSMRKTLRIAHFMVDNSPRTHVPCLALNLQLNKSWRCYSFSGTGILNHLSVYVTTSPFCGRMRLASLRGRTRRGCLPLVVARTPSFVEWTLETTAFSLASQGKVRR